MTGNIQDGVPEASDSGSAFAEESAEVSAGAGAGVLAASLAEGWAAGTVGVYQGSGRCPSE
ncbi:hypothetical protein GCM10025876_24080 [Demequina litorisediminis]|uniref:Uncharacterized protein n=1 Tax=Demequina litorisediminis TaxID=1849022 RepID=A0ABQ6IEB3_9MICO|nr:hypothetical protein GCM10025876_24080 [Demequina litorisediminis]